MAKKKKNSQQSATTKLNQSFNKLVDVIILGSSLSLGINNVAHDIMSADMDTFTKVKRLATRLGSRFGLPIGNKSEGDGVVINPVGAVSNGQFIAGIVASFIPKIRKYTGLPIPEAGKIGKWGKMNAHIGFWTGLISKNPPGISSLVDGLDINLAGNSALTTTPNLSQEVAVN